jgi:hypothetical protein
MTSAPRVSPLWLIGRAYVLEACPLITPECSCQMDEVVNRFLSGTLDYHTAAQSSADLMGTSQPIDKLAVIVTVPDEPPVGPGLLSPKMKTLLQKQNRVWSDLEDTRLLSGIHRFGLNAWGSIARFVGNNRTKAQCCQRWCRGLDPRISKTPWTSAEDRKLRDLVHTHGQKKWTRIALEFDNRCDVQCRYRYRQLQRMHFNGGTPDDASTEPPLTQREKILFPSIHDLMARADSSTPELTESSPKNLDGPCELT